MLVVTFGIIVDEDRADEVYDVLMNEFGVEFTNMDISYDEFCWAESEPRVYFECFVPFNRFEGLTDYLDNVFTGIAVLLKPY